MGIPHVPAIRRATWRRLGSSIVRTSLAILALIAGVLVMSPLSNRMVSPYHCLVLHRWEAKGVRYQGTCRDLGPFQWQVAILCIAPMLVMMAWLVGPRTRKRTIFWAIWFGLSLWGIARSSVAEPLWHPEFVHVAPDGEMKIYVGWQVSNAETAERIPPRSPPRRSTSSDYESRLLQTLLRNTWAQVETTAVMTSNNAQSVKEVADRVGREPVPDMVRRTEVPAARARRILEEIQAYKKHALDPPDPSQDSPSELRAMIRKLEQLKREVEAAYEESGEVSRALGRIPADPR